MKLPLVLVAVVLTCTSALATSYTFDVDNSVGKGWFSINLPDTWAGIPWGDYRDEQWFGTASDGAFTTFSGRDGSPIVVPWESLQVGFFNNHYGFPGVPPPQSTSAMLFVWLDTPPVPLGYNQVQTGIYFGATPLAAVDAISGVTLRQTPVGNDEAAVPDKGSTIALLGISLLGIFMARPAPLRCSSR